MRLLSVTKSTGGVAAFNRSLCERLHDRGHQVSVICLSEGNEAYARALQSNGIKATRMAMERYSIAPISDLGLVLKLRRYVRREPVDLILAHTAKAGLVARLVGRLTGTPTVYALHSMPFLRRVQGRRAWLYRQLERFGALLDGHIVAVADSMREDLRRNRIARASQISMIHTGIDLAGWDELPERAAACRALGLDPGRPVVGWAGRLNRQKAPLDYVRVAERVVRAVPGAQLFMAGEGPLAAEVRRLVERLDLGGSLLLAPWQREVPAMLASFDAYVSTSYWEGLPVAILEAMAARRAVVANAVDGVGEAIQHGVSGFLVEPGDLESLAGHIGRLLVDERLRSRVGAAARQRVEAAFTLERMVDEWESLLERQSRRTGLA